MIKYKPFMVLIISFIFASNLASLSAQWVNIFEIKNGNFYARADIDSSSVKKKIENKQKILFFTIQGKLFEGANGYDAYSTYKANCSTSEVWKNSSKLKVYDSSKGNSPILVNSKNIEKLQGKEYTEFQTILNHVCSKY